MSTLPTTPSPARPSASPATPPNPSAPEGFEVVDNPERLFDPEATLIMRATREPAPTHGLDLWIAKLLSKPVHELIWTSGRGVQAAFRRAAKSGQDFALARHLTASHLYASGADTAAALRSLGINPRLAAPDPRALAKRLPVADLHKQRVALQLDVVDASATSRKGHPLTVLLRAVQSRTYAVTVGTPKKTA